MTVEVLRSGDARCGVRGVEAYGEKRGDTHGRSYIYQQITSGR